MTRFGESFRARHRDRTDAEEAQRFEREKLCYTQNSEHLRSLNHFMWQVPLIAMTLTGGLWYGIAQLDDSVAGIRRPLLLLAGLANVGFMLVIMRVRFIFEQILSLTREFYPPGAASTDHAFLKNKLVQWVFCFLLGYAAVISFLAAIDPENYFGESNVRNERGTDTTKPKERLQNQNRP